LFILIKLCRFDHGLVILEFRVSGADVEVLSDALFAVGALSVDVTDADQGSNEERAIYL